ncbi:PPE family protein [Mycobacterium sp. Marseille-P9652]|uniref:PPE family protein n=1 Tax=Mycobacterium sp. Marseille-P9652 TaxID=2654950 RepID=UPI0012E7AF6A|nr:PPE family protein [Mycobacterium sp. Marseille-P9652]
MFYAAFPPEYNSGRMYAGPGSESMRAAAAAWDALAGELQSTVSACSSVIDGVAGDAWTGPSSVSMLAAVTPYLSWMQATAAQAAEASAQATAAAAAYETAFAAHVPPAEIAANRSQLLSLVATNLFGQNTPAIAATEVQYAEMWAQDALAMDTYASSSAAAARVTPFTTAPQVANAAGTAAQAAAVTEAAATPAGNVGSLLSAAASPLTTANPLLQTLANLSTDYTSTINGLLNSLFGPSGASTYTALFNAIKTPLGFTTGFNDIGLLINLPASQFLKFAPHAAAAGALPKDALGAGLGAANFGRGTLFNAVSGGMGNAGTLVDKLSVPPSWATNTPAVRMVASALSDAGPDAVPAAALGEGGLLGSMSLAGMLGSAVGAGAPTVVGRAGVRGRLTPLKDLKDKKSPEQLKRLVAQISEKPESVQHHSVDAEGLDSLLEQLSKKPGIHAVHLKKGDKPQVVPSDAGLG